MKYFVALLFAATPLIGWGLWKLTGSVTVGVGTVVTTWISMYALILYEAEKGTK